MHCTAVCLRQAISVAKPLRKPRGIGLPSGKLTQITSEKLCDDVLQLLRPSLPAPQTCDLIDLNPGRCLWSQKLHELIKPRRHVLVEPRREVFGDFIDPLLAMSNTPYRYAENIQMALDQKQGLLSADTYHFREQLGKAREQQYVVNNQLLMTANLSGAARIAIGFTGSEAKQVLNDYYRSLFVKENYVHQYGLIRLLAWVGEDSRKSIMPTTVISRTKQSVQFETTCEVEEVAGPSPFEVLHTHQSRWYGLDVESQDKARKSQQRLGLDIPLSRWQPDPVPYFTSLQPNIEVVRKNKDLYPHHQHYIQRILELDDKIVAEDPEWYTNYLEEADGQFQRASSKNTRGRASSPAQKAYRTFMTQLRTHHNTYLKAHDFIWEQRKLFHSFQQAYKQGLFSVGSESPKESVERKAHKLMREDELLQEQRQCIKADTRAQISKANDDYRCFDSDAQIMSWNRRRFDPLLVQKAEFTPHNPLTLFDIRPKPDLPLILDTVDKQICFDYVCTSLMMNSGDTVTQGLKRLVPADLESFIERVPELRDVNKGGWWNLEHVKVRGLHPDVFVAIALAFNDWPHRPPSGSLMNIYKGVFEEGPR